jgi:hypothetical protein
MMFAMTWARNLCFVAIIAALTAAPATQAQTPSAADLAPIARSAAPLIAALGAFRAKTGRCPALAERAEFAALLGRPIEPFSNGALNLTPGEIAPWIYQRTGQEPRRCSLSKKLGWDPDLVYAMDESGGRWILEPGDGGPERPLSLDP